MSGTVVRLVSIFVPMFVVGFMGSPSRALAQGGPQGSYRDSCRAISVERGGNLTAQCRTNSGSWKRASIHVSECKNQNIANLNGRLVCTKGRANGNDRFDKKNDGRRGNDRDDRYDRDRRDTRDDRGGRDSRDGRDRDRDGRWDNDGRDGRDRGLPGRNSRSSLTIYNNTRWGGTSMVVRNDYSNLERTGFNDIASSVRISGNGVWKLCSDKNFGGRCVSVSSDVSDLSRLMLNNKVSSIQQIR